MRFKNSFNFVLTLLSTLNRFVSKRKVIADFKHIESRLKLCRLCEHKVGDELKYMKCKICECKIRYKVRLSSSECPEGKWTSIDS